MSCAVRAFMLNSFLSMECVKEALTEMNVRFTNDGETVQVSFPNYDIRSKLIFQREGQAARMTLWGELPHDFMAIFTRVHERKVQEAIERLKERERRLREEATLRIISEEERLQEERRLRAERIELEAQRAEQEAERERIIEEKKVAIVEKAKRLGYLISEEVKGNEKRLVLIRRS